MFYGLTIVTKSHRKYDKTRQLEFESNKFMLFLYFFLKKFCDFLSIKLKLHMHVKCDEER